MLVFGCYIVCCVRRNKGIGVSGETRVVIVRHAIKAEKSMCV